MSDPRTLGLGLLLTLACSSATPSKLPRSSMLRYSASGTTGGVSYVVRQNGTVAYESTGDLGSRRIDTKLSQADLDKLSAELHDNDCCDLVSRQKLGRPDEPKPSFSVRMGDLDCEVSLWSAEIAESTEAQVCMASLHRFGEAIAKGAPAE